MTKKKLQIPSSVKVTDTTAAKKKTVLNGRYRISKKARKRAHKLLDRLIDLHNSFDDWSPLRYSKNILIQVGSQFRVSLYHNNSRQRVHYLNGYGDWNGLEHKHEFGPPEFKTYKEVVERAEELRDKSKQEEVHDAKVELHDNPMYILRELRRKLSEFVGLVNNKHYEYPGDSDPDEDDSWDPYEDDPDDDPDEDDIDEEDMEEEDYCR
jgi:hypothetical protein